MPAYLPYLPVLLVARCSCARPSRCCARTASPRPPTPAWPQELRAAGRDPYAYTFQRSHTTAELQAAYADLADGAVAEGASVAVAGRVLTRRFMGKLAFFKLVDASGSIQVSAPGCCAVCGGWQPPGLPCSGMLPHAAD